MPDLCLGDGIQHRRHFVGDQIPGLRSQGAGDAYALQFPAGQLLWPPVEPRALDAQGGEQGVLRRPALLQDLPDVPAGIDRFFRMLEDQLDGEKAGSGKGGAVHPNMTRKGFGITGKKARKRGFSAAARTGEADDFARMDPDIKPPEQPLAATIAKGQAFSLKSHGCTSPSCFPTMSAPDGW